MLLGYGWFSLSEEQLKEQIAGFGRDEHPSLECSRLRRAAAHHDLSRLRARLSIVLSDLQAGCSSIKGMKPVPATTHAILTKAEDYKLEPAIILLRLPPKGKAPYNGDCRILSLSQGGCLLMR